MAGQMQRQYNTISCNWQIDDIPYKREIRNKNH